VRFASLSNWGQGNWSTTGTGVFCNWNMKVHYNRHLQILCTPCAASQSYKLG
jgi:hypothetical protein